MTLERATGTDVGCYMIAWKKYLILLIFVLYLPGCNSDKWQTTERPIEFLKLYKESVSPILARRCGVGCHAVDVSNFSSFMLDPVNAKAFYFPIDVKTGFIPDEFSRQVYKIISSNERVNYSEDSRYSGFLRAPLAEEYGGSPHRGLDVFYSDEDPDYQTIKHWLDLEIAKNKKPLPIIPKHIAYFQNNVLPVMENNGCFLSSCHGNQVFNDLKLIPPLPFENFNTETITSRFSRKMVLENRKVVLGKVTNLVNFGSDLNKSRLIVKNLPIDKGGIHQRGGNIQFFESLDDLDVKTILHWLELEREALINKTTSEGKSISSDDLGLVKGIVYIRGPRHTPRKYFSFDEYYPGSDIYLLRINKGETLTSTHNKPINLTAQFHQQAIEIQSLDVRYDTKRIVFSMRKNKQAGFRLYELHLNENLDGVIGESRQLSYARPKLEDGTLIHHVDPIYAPGPNDMEGHELEDVAIAFASNEAGQYAISDTYGILGEIDKGHKRIIYDQQRYERAGTFTGNRIYFVAGPHKGKWRTIQQHLLAEKIGTGAKFILDKPMPEPLDRNSVYVIEKNHGLVQPSYDIWRFVPDSTQASSGDAKQLYQNSLRQMTFSYAQERRPTMRTSGEVMFTSVRNLGYQGDKPIFNGAIYRIQAGGFDYHIQGGNRSGYPLFSDSRELGNGLEIRQLHDPRNYWSGGMLILSDHGLGIHIESDNPLDNIPYSKYSNIKSESDFQSSSTPRFIPSQIPFFPEQGAAAVTNSGVSLGGSIREPFPLLDGRVLTSYTSKSLDHLDPNADPDWDLYTIKFNNSPHTKNGNDIGAFRLERIEAASSDMAEYSARPIMIRLKEKAELPIHHQKFGYLNETIKPVNEHGVLRMEKGLPGEIQCYDYPLLQSFLTNFIPVGSRSFIQEKNSKIEKKASSDFKFVRIVQQLPADKESTALLDTPTISDPFASKTSLGIHNKRIIVAEVPLEEDGSFYVEVPTEVPLIIQGLNKDKMAIHSMNRWFYLQAGEKLTFSIPRSIFPLRCSGCHGSLTGKPEQGTGPVDLVSASSRVMATWNALEQKTRKPYAYGKNNTHYIGIGFLTDIQPILDKHCIACHNKDHSLNLSSQLTKHYNTAYESLHTLTDPKSGNYADKKYINEREALSSQSPLLSIISDENHKGSGKPLLNESERLTLIRWIDLGSTFEGGRINEK